MQNIDLLLSLIVKGWGCCFLFVCFCFVLFCFCLFCLFVFFWGCTRSIECQSQSDRFSADDMPLQFWGFLRIISLVKRSEEVEREGLVFIPSRPWIKVISWRSTITHCTTCKNRIHCSKAVEKIKLHEPWMQNSKQGIPGSTRSMQSFILTDSRFKENF